MVSLSNHEVVALCPQPQRHRRRCPAGNWVDRFAPAWLKPYARLARWDRPIGFWLLFWPCGFALALAAIANPPVGFDWWRADPVLCRRGR